MIERKRQTHTNHNSKQNNSKEEANNLNGNGNSNLNNSNNKGGMINFKIKKNTQNSRSFHQLATSKDNNNPNIKQSVINNNNTNNIN